MPGETNAATEGAKVFTGASDPKLPSNVRDLSVAKRRQWVGAWNGRFKQCQADGGSEKDCESSAFAVANAAIKELQGDEGEKFVEIYPYEVTQAQLTQDEAEYDPVGGSTDRACGNCRWFSTPNKCIIVRADPDPINPNGISNRWEAVADPIEDREPVPVVIVEGSAEANQEEGEKAETKREGGVNYPAADFAVVPDAEKASTWKLRVAEERAGNVTVAQVGRAITAMQPSGFRGNRVSLTSQQKTQAVSRIGGAIGKTGGTDEQKANLRERLNAVKSRTLQVVIPQRLLTTVKDRILALIKRDPEEQRPFLLFKDDEGNLRWFAWASNRWRDHDDPPEIISEKAHQNYIEYLDRTGQYPEAWLWHTPKTRWGKADWADYADGFLVLSGTVDPGREHIADSLAAQKDLGVSHGYVCGYSDPQHGIIGRYRSFEVSPLPVDAAANPWTSFEVLNKEADMAFSDKKREWLVGQLGEGEVKRLEGDTEAMKAALVAKGVEFKDAPEDDQEDGEKNGDEQVPTEAAPGDTQTAAEAVVKALTESDAFKAIATGQAEITEQVKGLADRITELEKTDDEKIAAAVGGRARQPNGHVASKSGDNVVRKDEKVPAPEDTAFFDNTIMAGLETEVKAE